MEPANIKGREILRWTERTAVLVFSFLFWNAVYYGQRLYVWARYHKFSLSYWRDKNYGGY